MKIQRLIFSCIFGVALAHLAGCGGKVVIDQGESGLGGAGSGSTSNSSSGSGSTSTSGGGTDVKAACSAVCEAFENGGCGQMNCLNDCLNTYAAAGACADLYGALVQCYSNHLDVVVTCGQPKECLDAENAYAACQQTGTCGTQVCAQDSSGSCSCDVTCQGSMFESQCSPGPDGQFACVCLINNNPTTKCIGAATCDVFQGCCAPFFFGQP